MLYLKKKKGFTLIELMVVIAIIAVLAAVVTPQVFRQVARGRIASSEGFHNAMKTSATNYFGDLAAWPRSCGPGLAQDCNTDVGLAVAGITPGGFVAQGTNTNWDGPYIDRFPAAGSNPWRGNYRWYNNGAGTVFNAVGNGERYIYMSNLQTADIQRIDTDKDGAIGTNTGIVQYGAGNPAPCDAAGVVCVLISRDGPVS